MTEFNAESLASIDPKDFPQLVKSTPDSKIAEVMGSDDRAKILDEVFNRMPTLFRADRAGVRVMPLVLSPWGCRRAWPRWRPGRGRPLP